MEVMIKHVPARRVVAIRHRGPYCRIGEAFDRLREYAAARGLRADHDRVMAVYEDDPSVVPEAELKSAACVEAPAGFVLREGDPAEMMEIAGGEYAVAVHRGPYAKLGESYRWLVSEWLPRSGRTGAAGACFEMYPTDPRTTAEGELETVIHLPVG